MFSTRVLICLLVLAFAAAATALYFDVVLGRALNDSNVSRSLQVCILASLISLKLTQNLRVIALDGDARLFSFFTLLIWGVVAASIVIFRLQYSGALFAVFNAVFVPSTVLVLYMLSRQPLVIGIFSRDLESDLSKFGRLVSLKGPHDTELRRCDVIVGRITSGDTTGVSVVNKSNSAESRAMERVVMWGRVPAVSYHDFMESRTGKLSVANVPALASMSLRLRLAYGPVKRALDICLCIPIGLVLLVLTPFVVFAIKIETPGPAFFIQRRFGFQGQSFKLVKFRTMTNDIGYAANLGADDGHRITKVGALLRRTRLDELPQLFNVLKGEMSWIGPRPETITLARQYLRSVPYFRLRHLVRPGVTGWAQVHQGYTFGAEEFSEKVLHDLYYIKHYSPVLDMVIAFKTIAVVVAGRGAR